MFGPTDAGKSLFVYLIASLWNQPAVEDFFSNSTFQEHAGRSPVIFMDEDVPTSTTRGISTMNNCKLLVTNNHTSINRKYEVACSILGYHRLYSAQNADYHTLPIDNMPDLGAIARRILVVKFTKENAHYMTQFTRKQTSAWLDHEFGEWMAWHQLNHTPRESQGLFGVKPYETEHFNQNSITGEKMRNILEVMIVRRTKGIPNVDSGLSRNTTLDSIWRTVN